MLLLAAILGLYTFVNNLINIATFRPSFAAQTVTSLVRMHYPVVLHLEELVPPDASLNLLHVAVLGLNGRTIMKDGDHPSLLQGVTFETISHDHPSLLKSLVTSDSFRHTLHEYLPNGLTPLDLAEKVELDEAVTIISSAGGRHGIYAMISEEVWLQHGPALLLAHRELMKVASSGALGQQAVQAVISQLPGRTTVEQGTATEESHIHQQKEFTHLRVIKDNSKRFLEEMNAKAIALTLYGQDLIPESVKHDIDHSKCREDANVHLLTHLKEDAAEEQVQGVFKVASEKAGYGRMNEFASNILQTLQQGAHHHSTHDCGV